LDDVHPAVPQRIRQFREFALQVCLLQKRLVVAQNARMLGLARFVVDVQLLVALLPGPQSYVANGNIAVRIRLA